MNGLAWHRLAALAACGLLAACGGDSEELGESADAAATVEAGDPGGASSRAEDGAAYQVCCASVTLIDDGGVLADDDYEVTLRQDNYNRVVEHGAESSVEEVRAIVADLVDAATTTQQVAVAEQLEAWCADSANSRLTLRSGR